MSQHPSRPAWVGLIVDVVAIVAALVLVWLHGVTGREALGWIALVQSGRLFVWATRNGRKKAPDGLPPSSESGLLVVLVAVGGLARELAARAHFPHA